MANLRPNLVKNETYFHFLFSTGPLTNTEESATNGSMPHGRRLVTPLNICVLQGLSFVKARLLSMDIPAHVGENPPNPVQVEGSLTNIVNGSDCKTDRLIKIDPYRGSWGLRFLELELSNPTDVLFEIGVSVQLENSNDDNSASADGDIAEFGYPKTRIDRDYSARVLIPLEHFKLPVLDGTFLVKDSQKNGATSSRNSSFSEKNTKAELNASIKNLISRIKVRWQSGRNSSGELNIKDAIQAALRTSVMDVLLPDPLTFGFRLAKSYSGHAAKPHFPEESDIQINSPASKGSVLAHDMTPMEVLVRNNTKDMIKLSLSITCRDVAGENCVEGNKATVLWAGENQTEPVFKFKLFIFYLVLQSLSTKFPTYKVDKEFSFSKRYLVCKYMHQEYCYGNKRILQNMASKMIWQSVIS